MKELVGEGMDEEVDLGDHALSNKVTSSVMVLQRIVWSCECVLMVAVSLVYVLSMLIPCT